MAEASNAPKRFCTECGARIEEGMAFCTSCGTPVGEGVPAQGSAVSEAVAPVSATTPLETVSPVRPVTTASVADSAQGSSAAHSNRTPLIIALVLAAVAVIALVVVLIFVFLVPPSEEPTEANTEVAAVQPKEEANSEREEKRESATNSSSMSRNTSRPESATTQEPTPSVPAQSGYVLSDSNTRYYTASELERMDLHDLYLARNEIFARHGRMFNNADLQSYFNKQSWYHGTIAPSDFDESVFNDYERKNATLILEVERDQGSPYLNP